MSGRASQACGACRRLLPVALRRGRQGTQYAGARLAPCTPDVGCRLQRHEADDARHEAEQHGEMQL
jgi:hypothetical protein